MDQLPAAHVGSDAQHERLDETALSPDRKERRLQAKRRDYNAENSGLDDGVVRGVWVMSVVRNRSGRPTACRRAGNNCNLAEGMSLRHVRQPETSQLAIECLPWLDMALPGSCGRSGKLDGAFEGKVGGPLPSRRSLKSVPAPS